LTGQSLHESLIEALASFLPDLELVSKIVLENAKQVTGSRHGFVGTIDQGTKALVIQTFKVEEKCLVKEKKSVFYPDENGRYSGLFGYALNEKTAFYTNSPKAHPASKGTPEGHVPIERFMAVPVALGGKLLGLIALANPEKDYTEEDLEKVKTIAKYFAIALEHYRIENKLRTIASLYETLVEDVPLPTLVIEEDDTVSYVNSAFEELTGYSKNEVIGKMKWHQFGQKDYVEKAMEYKRRRLEGLTAPPVYEYKVVSKSGKIYDVNVYAKVVPGTRKIIASWVDVTKVKRMEKRLRVQARKLRKYSKSLEKMVEEKVKELREKEELAALGQMTLMVAHDLRNPLQAISNYTFLLDEAVKGMSDGLKEKLTKYVESIERSVNYMEKVLKDLQQLSKREPKIETANLKTLVEDMFKNISKPENVNLVLDVDDVQAQLDPLLIARALSNLILNSIQAMPEGGTLTVKAKSKEDAIEFTVQDTGIGMTEEVKRNLFKPFHTTKSKGMGLGLTIVKHIVNLHNGTVEAESEPNKGTKITIRIPKKKGSNRSIPE